MIDMAFSVEEYDKILEELGSEDLSAGRKAILLSEIRSDYAALTDHIKENTKLHDSLKAENEDLSKVNIDLFRKSGEVLYGGSPVQVKQKSFSESITIESLEKGLR